MSVVAAEMEKAANIDFPEYAHFLLSDFLEIILDCANLNYS